MLVFAFIVIDIYPYIASHAISSESVSYVIHRNKSFDLEILHQMKKGMQ